METVEFFVEKIVYWLFRSLVLICTPLELFKNEMVRRNPNASGIFFSAFSFIAFVVTFSLLIGYYRHQDEMYREFWNQFTNATQ